MFVPAITNKSPLRLALRRLVETRAQREGWRPGLIHGISFEVKSNEIILTTDEIEVSAFLKILFDKGARIEVYSAHSHPDTGHGR